ncbi:MAG: hypothetical protein QXM76_01725 [Zestosphaera sp.]
MKEPVDDDMLREILYVIDARTRRDYKIVFREKR